MISSKPPSTLTCAADGTSRLSLPQAPALSRRRFHALRSLAGRVRNEARSQIFRHRIKDRNFSVLSNNCWGAHLYQSLGERYRTPFVGLFLMPDCYLRLLAQFREKVSLPLSFCRSSRYDWVNEFRDTRRLDYPIGRLGDEIELHFQHYGSASEAADKWIRRLTRLHPSNDRVFVKFCDFNGLTAEQYSAFDRLPFPNKVCFTAADDAPNLPSVVRISNPGEGHVPDGLALSRLSARYFDAAGWLNGASARTYWRLLRCA